MSKKHTKNTKHVTVYRPNILDLGRSAPIDKPVTMQVSGSHVSVVGDLLAIIILSLATAVVTMAGTLSQSDAKHPHTLATAYNPAILTHSLPNAAKTSSKHHVSKKIPTALGQIQPQPELACNGKTIMNIVAHEDDDLLFINPDITHDLAHHDCVRTVYVTAGDDGRGAAYLLQRETGSRAAYSVMLHSTEPWNYQQLVLTSGSTVVSASPYSSPDVSLIFLRLPDGNLDGEGFDATGRQSLARLKAGAISEVTSIDGGQAYTSDQLVATLTALMQLYQPVRINTQAQDNGMVVADHSDHITTGQYTASAAEAYAKQAHHPVMVRNFMGYPIRSMLANLPAGDVAQKSAAFFAYAANDPGVCMSLQMCAETRSSYGLYLRRQYLGVGQ